MFDIPKQHTLSAQAADAIRKAIAEGMWKEHLPGERRLCSLFHVSRPTIRTALRLLARQGLVAIHPRQSVRLLKAPVATAPASQLIVLVGNEPSERLSTLRANLALHNFTTEAIVCPGRNFTSHRRKLESFARENRVSCWVLVSVSRELQQWFSDRAMPALVLGSCHANVNLPSLDVDYRSVCRHAAGVFLSRGHRQIALIITNSRYAGDLASEQGFAEAAGGHRTDDIGLKVVRHDGSTQSLLAKLNGLFGGADVPTALLIARPCDVVTVLLCLPKRGHAIPDTVSLIARDHDDAYDLVISHYAFGANAYAQLLSRLVQQMADRGFLPAKPSLIFPDYRECGTVGKLS